MTSGPRLPPRVEPLRPGADGRLWTWVPIAGAAGAGALVVAYLALRPFLAPMIPSHYGAAGQVTASMTPLAFVLNGLAIQAIVTIGLAAAMFLGLRSGVVARQQGTRGVRLVVAVVGFVAATGVPAPLIVLLTADAGALPTSAAAGADAAVLLLAAPLLLVALLLARSRPGSGRDGAGVLFQCSSCGQSFAPASSLWWLAPHLGASLYLRCTHCGELGWSVRVAPAPDAHWSAPGPR